MIVDVETLPRDIRAERRLIGGLLLFPTRADELLPLADPWDFSDTFHEQLWAKLKQQQKSGGIDIARIRTELEVPHSATGDLTKDYLDDLGGEVATTVHAQADAAAIIEARRKRQLFSIVTDARYASCNGQSFDDSLRILNSELDDLRRESIADKPKFTAISSAEFASASYELNYLIPGLLVEGQPTIAAASKKGMKTSLLMDYSIAQAAGGAFLGYFPITDRRRVLFCSGESGPATLQETALRQCSAAGYDLAALDQLLISTDLPRCGSADSLEDFRRFIGDEGAEVVIVDPAYLCFPAADAGNVFAQGELLRGLNDVIAEQKATLILVHHTKKQIADPYGQPELENIAWAGFQEYARQWWLLGRREPYQPGSGIHRLWLSVGGSAGHGNLFAVDIDEGTYDTIGGRYWRVNVQKASEARGDAEKRKNEAKAELATQQLEADKAAICRAVAKHPGGVSKTHIRESAGVSGRRFPVAFAALLDDGQLIECEIVVSNHKTPRVGFKLANTEST